MQIRRAVFWIHLASGCLTGVAILFLSATGCILVYEKQAIAWQERGYCSAPPPADTSPLPLDRLLAIATATTGKQPSAAIMRADANAPVEIDFGHEQRVFLNRYTGAVLGSGAVRTRAFFDAVTGLHRWFGVSPENRPASRAVQGTVDLTLLLMIISGGFLWLPGSLRWQRLRAASFFRSGLAGRAREWNRHCVLGLWLAFPIAVITITGAMMAFGWATNLLYLATGSPLPEPAHAAAIARHRSRQNAEPKQPTSFVDMQQIVDNAERQAAGWRLLRIAMPDHEDRSITVSIDFLDSGRPDQTVELVVDRRTGAILKSNTFSSHSLGSKLRLFIRSIHTGSAGGLAGQTAAGITGLGCCWLVWTGLSMSLRRLRGSAMFTGRTLRSETVNVHVPATPQRSTGSEDNQLE
jgi:uncharacterized iron-regulated membrane protein